MSSFSNQDSGGTILFWLDETNGFAQLDEAQAHKMLNLTRGGVPTLAAVLNFGIYPQGFFPQLAVTAIVVPGTEIGDTAKDRARFLNNKRIEGSLADMVDESISFCRRSMKNRTIIDPNTGVRADKTEYPI